jgi:hypothetical protein
MRSAGACLGAAVSRFKNLSFDDMMEYESMQDTKPWYLSRTIWASVVTVMMALAGYLNLPVQDGDHALVTEALFQIVSALAGLTGIAGRLLARDRIG